MSLLHAFAMMCAIGMVGQDADRPTDEETRRLAAELQVQIQEQGPLQVQFQIQIQGQLQLQLQGEGQLVIELMRPTAEQQVQETRRARLAEARMRSAVEIVGGPIIGDSFRSGRRRPVAPEPLRLRRMID